MNTSSGVDASSGSGAPTKPPDQPQSPKITMNSMFDGIVEVESSLAAASNNTDPFDADLNSGPLEWNDDHVENPFDDAPTRPKVSYFVFVK